MDSYIGEIVLVAFSYAPSGWAKCQGQVIPISQNMALFSLLGTSYGGDGRTTFCLPNLSAPPNMTYIICLTGYWPSRP